MATSSSSKGNSNTADDMSGRLLANVTKDYLSCPICFERFREPKTLPCEHTFCLQCLAAQIERSREEDHFICPIDRREITFDNKTLEDPWVIAAEFNTDPVLLGFLKVVQNPNNAPRRGSDALDFYCFGCKTLVSAEAAISSHKDSQCDCLKLRKAFKKMIPSISGYNKELEHLIHESQKLRNSREERQGLTESQQEVLNQINLFEAKIESFFFDCKEQLSVLKTEVMEYKTGEEDDQGEVNGSKLNAVHDAITDAYAELNNALEDDDVMKVVANFGNLKPRIHSLRKRLLSVQACSERMRSFEFVPDASVQELVHRKLRIGILHSIEHFHFSVGQAADVQQTNLYDICVTDTYLLVTDGANNTIKRFLLDGTFVDNLSLVNPCRIAAVNEAEVMVTRFYKKKATVVTLGRRMHVKDHMKTKRPYVGVTSLSYDKFAFTYYDDNEPAGIDVVNKDGKVLHNFTGMDHTYGLDPLFVVPMFLATTGNGHIILCDYSHTKNVVCFDQQLNVLWRQQMDSVPCGVTTDGDSVYVSLPDEDKLVALYQNDGETLRQIIRPCDGVKRPYALSIYKGQMAVTEDESDKIHMLTV